MSSVSTTTLCECEPHACVEVTNRTSHALELIAGPMANQLAEFFSFPHSGFLNLPAPAMHSCGMTLSTRVSATNDVPLLLDHHKCDWREAAIMTSPAFNTDNVCVLRKMKLPLWESADYRLLSSLLTCSKSIKIMKHSAVVTADLVRILSSLPDRFRSKKIVGFLISEHEAELLEKLFFKRSEMALARIKNALENCTDRQHFFNKVSEHYFSDMQTLPAGPVIDDGRFKPITTTTDLQKTGLAFRNCLKSYRFDSIGGEVGFYRFEGREKAVISYQPRIDGRFVVDEILGPDNCKISTETRGEIRTVMEAHGFRFQDTDPASIHQEIDFKLNRLGCSQSKNSAGKTALKLIRNLNNLE
jgi:hypothetical protein